MFPDLSAYSLKEVAEYGNSVGSRVDILEVEFESFKAAYRRREGEIYERVIRILAQELRER